MPRKTRMRKSRKRNRKTVRRRNRKISGGGIIPFANISEATANKLNGERVSASNGELYVLSFETYEHNNIRDRKSVSTYIGTYDRSRTANGHYDITGTQKSGNKYTLYYDE